MTRFLKYALSLVAVALLASSCQQDDMFELPDVKDGYTAISVPVKSPDMIEVNTRALDPDGAGIHTIQLFCFDALGHHIEWVPASIQADGALPSLSGKIIKAEIPSHTRIIHFVGNQSMSRFTYTDFKGQTEKQMMAELEGSSGMMIYWGRFVIDPTSNLSIQEQLKAETDANGPIQMLRNQAKFVVRTHATDDSWLSSFELEGFTVVNTSAFGTVAPLHPTKGFDFTVVGNPSDWSATDFVTLPQNKVKLSPPNDIDDAESTFVFETENLSSDPVSVIIKGKNNSTAETLYYRAVLIDDEGEQLLVRRNHQYNVNIKGDLSYGQPTFAAALTAPATNNVWLSIDDEVNEVENSDYVLTVEKTDVVLVYDDDAAKSDFVAGDKLTLNYSLKSKNGNITAADKPSVTWVDNAVANELFEHDFIVTTGANAAVSNSEITITLKALPAGQQMATGTLLVKKGLLQRKIKVVVMRRQKFTPAWVTTQMYGGDTNDATEDFDGSNVTLLFTVPETCPDEMLPFEVYISVDHLDVRAESGVVLPVIRQDDPRYGEDVLSHPNAESTDAMYGAVIGYKYVYTVTKKGDQRVYFKNILDQTGRNALTDHEHSEYVTLESPNFETLRKPYLFSVENHQRVITLSNLATYNAFGSSSSDEQIYYMLVPQKQGALVEFNIKLMNEATNTALQADQYSGVEYDKFDEFLLYSESLDHNHTSDHADCVANFLSVSTALTSSRTFGMRLIKDYNADSEYKVKMHTNRAKSAEVVRIASNQYNSPAIWPVNEDSNGNYAGTTYRSVIFELANYRPFRFAAQVQYGAGDYQGEFVDHDAGEDYIDTPSDIVWDYQPDQKVKVAFDLTDFKAADGKEIDPFGQEFEVYIKAPMLEIDSDENHLPVEKFYYDDAKGVFVYKVAATREAENAFWDGEPMTGAATLHAAAGRSKAGERKLLPFKTKQGQIVKEGQIEISSNLEKVVYDSKIFNVKNTPITGKIQYGTAGSLQNVPANAFVAFALVEDGSRIGSLTIGADGAYTLTLRSEYDFDWKNDSNESDKIEILYMAGGKTYRATYDNLAALWSNKNIQMLEVI